MTYTYEQAWKERREPETPHMRRGDTVEAKSRRTSMKNICRAVDFMDDKTLKQTANWLIKVAKSRGIEL